MPAPIMDFKDNGDGTVTLFYHCIACDKPSSVIVNKAKFEAWKSGQGGFIQNVFPELSPGDREIMISGTHSDCFDKMFDDPNELDKLDLESRILNREEEEEEEPPIPEYDPGPEVDDEGGMSEHRGLDPDMFPDGGYTA